MDDYLFTLYRALLQTRCGLYYSADNRPDLERGVGKAMALAEIRDVQDLYQWLEANPTTDMTWKILISQLTVPETYFFRDAGQFRALREEVLPQLIKDRREKKMRLLRIWSAGCSTGEEPYSLAILIRELLGEESHEWLISIRGTDINHASLEQAKAGVYGQWSFRMETPPHVQERYFLKRGDRYELDYDIKRMVNFSYLNLVEDSYPSIHTDTTSVDLILCRNVTIYFDKSTTREIARRFYNSLIEGGWLVVGHSEPMSTIYADFQPYNYPHAIFYRKPFKYQQRMVELSKTYIPDAEPEPPRRAEPAPPPVPKKEKKRETLTIQIDDIYSLMLRGERDKAREMLSSLLEKTPQHIDGLFLLAKISADEGEMDGVHHILDTIDQLNPLVPQAHYLRALLYQQGAAWQDAKASLRRALYADRNFALAHYYMGELLYTEGNIEQARRSWQNAANLLAGGERDTLIPYGDGTTVGTLLHAIEQRLKSL